MKLSVDFARDSMQGQMRPVEREAMYNAVVSRKPAKMLEIGTWKGGGSTYILSCAAYEYGGKLHTIELNKEFHESAKRLFSTRMNILEPFVEFHLGKSQDVIPDLLRDGGFGFVLFDGAEDADQTVLEYGLLNQSLGLGSVIACHDWKTSKMEKMKDVIAADCTWNNIVMMTNTDTGFAMFERTL